MRAEMVRAIDAGVTPRQRLAAVAWTFFQRSHADFGRLMSDVHTHLPEEMPERRSCANRRSPGNNSKKCSAKRSRRATCPRVDRSLAATLFAGVIWGQIWVRKVERVTEPLTQELAGRLVDILLAGLANLSCGPGLTGRARTAIIALSSD